MNRTEIMRWRPACEPCVKAWREVQLSLLHFRRITVEGGGLPSLDLFKPGARRSKVGLRAQVLIQDITRPNLSDHAARSSIRAEKVNRRNLPALWLSNARSGFPFPRCAKSQ